MSRAKMTLLGIALMLFGMALMAHAQEVSVTASVDPQRVSVDESLTLVISVSDANVQGTPKPTLPALANFDVMGTSSSSNISYVNGRVSSTREYRYTLMPRSAGIFTIDPVEVRIGGKSWRTEPVRVEVVQTGQRKLPTSPPAQGEPSSPAEAPAGGRAGENLFITTEVDKPKAYVGQQLVLTFTYYSRLSVWDAPQYTPPETPGFWVEELSRDERSRRVVIEGRPFEMQQIKTALFPTSSGKQVISPAYLQYSTGRGFFSQGQTRRLRTDPIEVEVLPLPDKGKPSDFSGAVGQYALSAKVDKATVARGDPILLEVIVSGAGNIATVGNPKMPALEGFKLYEPEIEKSAAHTGEVIRGEKVFRYALIPEREGALVIPPVTFVCFDPQEKAYRTLKTPPFRITVTPGPAQEMSPVGYGLTREEIKLVGQDIRFIKPASGALRKASGTLVQSGKFWAMQLIPLFFGIGVFFLKQHREKMAGDVAYVRRRRARGEARRRLKAARQLLRTHDSSAFYGEIHRALTQFVGDRLNMPSAGLTMGQISGAFAARGMEEGVTDRMETIFGRCDAARFAPATHDDQELDRLLQDAEALIGHLEKTL
ncbi:MAG: BatD family protein [Candidatus Latescibacterota bacterium]